MAIVVTESPLADLDTLLREAREGDRRAFLARTQPIDELFSGIESEFDAIFKPEK